MWAFYFCVLFLCGFLFFFVLFFFCFLFFLVQHNLEHLKAFQPKCGEKQVRHYFCTKLAFLNSANESGTS